MRKSSILMPLFALIAGATGFYLRTRELAEAFDTGGLPKPGAGITYALLAFSAVILIIALIFSILATAKNKAPDGFEKAFGTDPLAYPSVFSLIGIVWFGATVKYYLDLKIIWPLPAMELIFLILSALSAISIAFFAIEMYQDPRRKAKYFLSIVPSAFMCFWLIVIYRQNASNPVLLSYCYQCMAIIASTLGFYFTSGFVYEKPASGKSLFAYFSAIYLCFVTLADKHSTSIMIIISSLIAINLLHSVMLIKNLQPKEV